MQILSLFHTQSLKEWALYFQTEAPMTPLRWRGPLHLAMWKTTWSTWPAIMETTNQGFLTPAFTHTYLVVWQLGETTQSQWPQSADPLLKNQTLFPLQPVSITISFRRFRPLQYSSVGQPIALQLRSMAETWKVGGSSPSVNTSRSVQFLVPWVRP